MSHAMKKANFFQVIAKRGYSTQVGYKQSKSADVNVNVTTKNIKLVSTNERSPLARVTYSFQAGSRYETADTLGITHVLRKAVGLSSLDYTPFNISRHAYQYGFRLYTTVDRDVFSVTVETHPSKLDIALDYLNSIATKPAFKPWEISDNIPRIELDLQFVSPQAKILDALHTVAYRDGLGNSLFVEPSRLKKFNNEHLLQYFNEHFTAKRLQITSVGVPVQVLEKLPPTIELQEVAGPQAPKTVYYGGENRIPNYEENCTYVAVAGQSPGYSKKEYLPYAVLQYVYGNVPPMKYGVSSGILNKELTATGALGVLTGISANYADYGLVGFLYVADAADAVKGYTAVVKAFLKSNITDADVKRGKACLKAALLENSGFTQTADFLTKQVELNPLITLEQLAAGVDAITTADVKQAAKKLTEGQLSVVSYGYTAGLPYFDTLKK